MDSKLCISSSPHLHSKINTRKIMLDVIIALIPTAISTSVIFGARAILLICITTISCVLSELISRIIMRRSDTSSDLSAIVTGILLAFNLPVNINAFIAIFGSVIAIVVVKQLFGGLGQNFVNPALCARIILLISFPKDMSAYTFPFSYLTHSLDATTNATPLSHSTSFIPNYTDLFTGNIPGSLGEVCSLTLILGGIYLVVRKVISLTIPLTYIGTVFIFTFLLGKDPIFHILSGGLLLGAIFMATDYVTSPVTFKGKIIFGIGCGIITVLIRVFGSLPEGVSFAIVLMNILVPHIEKLTMPKAFGWEGKVNEKI